MSIHHLRASFVSMPPDSVPRRFLGSGKALELAEDTDEALAIVPVPATSASLDLDLRYHGPQYIIYLQRHFDKRLLFQGNVLGLWSPSAARVSSALPVELYLLLYYTILHCKSERKIKDNGVSYPPPLCLLHSLSV